MSERRTNNGHRRPFPVCETLRGLHHENGGPSPVLPALPGFRTHRNALLYDLYWREILEVRR